MKIGNRYFDLNNQVYMMGILNVTPDSFSDGGKWNQLDAALRHVEEMVNQGMDILDIGGESTRPGYTQLAVEEEIERVVPVIEAVKAQFDVPVSIDTYKGEVAEAAAKAGADLLNDIWGFAYERRCLGLADAKSAMAEVAVKYQLPVCLMHNRVQAEYGTAVMGNSDKGYEEWMQKGVNLTDAHFLGSVAVDLLESVEIALKAGVPREQVILDPGFGFGKDYRQNMVLMKHLEVVTELGYPVLLGTSRKSMIGLTLDLPAEEREEGTLATTVMGIEKGCSIIRVHNVQANVRAARMTRAILQA